MHTTLRSSPFLRDHLSKVFVLFMALVTASCSLVWEPLGWNAIQEVGGITAEDPINSADGWTLPVRADLSGVQTITVKPTMINSALVCKSVHANVEGQDIFLTVIRRLARKGDTPVCGPAKLGKLRPGTYRVFYRHASDDAVPLRDITIGS